jgi:hypothetical protein
MRHIVFFSIDGITDKANLRVDVKDIKTLWKLLYPNFFAT